MTQKNNKIPTHVAIILDGNGRWAQNKGLNRSQGHKKGAQTLKDIVSYCAIIKLKYLSVFCFSTENFKREKKEIDYLFSLPVQYFSKYEDNIIKKNIKVIFSGDLSKLPFICRLYCNKIAKKTSNCTGLTLNICLNYGFIDEMIMAIQNIVKDVKDNNLKINQIDKTLIERYLYSKDLPSIDLLIRTSNEQRLSNFMLWQLSYAELYFTSTLWPDFTRDDLDKALIEYSKRKRRYGGA